MGSSGMAAENISQPWERAAEKPGNRPVRSGRTLSLDFFLKGGGVQGDGIPHSAPLLGTLSRMP